jgi:threonine dehydratase
MTGIDSDVASEPGAVWIPLDDGAHLFAEASRVVGRDIHQTPVVTSRLLSERTGFDVRLKAEVLQRTGSYTRSSATFVSRALA